MNRSTALATVLAATSLVGAPALAAPESAEPVRLSSALSLDRAEKDGIFLSGGPVAADIRLANGGGGGKMPWLSALLNFFLGGAGYVYNGERVLLGLGLTAGAVGLTYAEYVTSGGNFASPKDPAAFWPIFGSVFVMSTVLAIDAYNEAAELD
ncbi:MAG: hypothetical protein FJZ01_26270 [Candidatus Sericytochromatia bacterium]|nr:hypothetical protein [Candidatus Tanganyikabacteria bacterium]